MFKHGDLVTRNINEGGEWDNWCHQCQRLVISPTAPVRVDLDHRGKFRLTHLGHYVGDSELTHWHEQYYTLHRFLTKNLKDWL